MSVSTSVTPPLSPAEQLQDLLEPAIKQRASVIHIEPRTSGVIVRYRVDGVLRDAGNLPKEHINNLLSPLKSLANLSAGERPIPQEGHCSLSVGDAEYSLHVSLLPTIEGEKTVIRLEPATSKIRELTAVGLWGYSLEVTQSALKHHRGLLIVSGPVNSGITSSLFSLVGILADTSTAVVEESNAYIIPGAYRAQVNRLGSIGFATGLKTALRHDPKVIVVGEVSDSQTAQLSMEAAQKRLVIAGMSTPTAIDSLRRLMQMGTPPFLIAHTLRAVLNQRLARRLCEQCKQSYKPSTTDLKHLAEAFDVGQPLDIQHLHSLEQTAREAGVTSDKHASTTESHITRLWRPASKGCKNCDYSGYSGRIGLFEVVQGSSDLQRLLTSQASSQALLQQATKAGTISVQRDGLIKSLLGLTDTGEVLRVSA